MNVGIVTTWFERGAAYVSREFEEIISERHNVYIYARGGESYAIGDTIWDKPNVTWGKKIRSPFVSTVIEKKDFEKWLKNNKIEVVIFNEQHWFQPILWCNRLNIRTIAYIDYYNEITIPLFNIYDTLICNTKRHQEAFQNHPNAIYVPWGTDINLYRSSNFELVAKDKVTFFHSAGINGHRKGTDLFIRALDGLDKKYKAIIHTQVTLSTQFPELENLIQRLTNEGKLEIILKTIPAPGLYYKGDIYIYPSRLEGIGLTISEAISSGLACVVPDNGPMNEFVNSSFGFTIPIDRFYSRSDGYYWPKCEIKIESLRDILNIYINNPNLVVEHKRNSRIYAEQKLSYKRNFHKLFEILQSDTKSQLTKSLISQVNAYDSFGLKRFQKYYLKYKIYNIWH